MQPGAVPAPIPRRFRGHDPSLQAGRLPAAARPAAAALTDLLLHTFWCRSGCSGLSSTLALAQNLTSLAGRRRGKGRAAGEGAWQASWSSLIAR